MYNASAERSEFLRHFSINPAKDSVTGCIILSMQFKNSCNYGLEKCNVCRVFYSRGERESTTLVDLKVPKFLSACSFNGIKKSFYAFANSGSF